jgi:hypothetical protein
MVSNHPLTDEILATWKIGLPSVREQLYRLALVAIITRVNDQHETQCLLQFHYFVLLHRVSSLYTFCGRLYEAPPVEMKSSKRQPSTTTR